jgi:hypothetical protein
MAERGLRACVMAAPLITRALATALFSCPLRCDGTHYQAPINDSFEAVAGGAHELFHAGALVLDMYLSRELTEAMRTESRLMS